MTFIFSDSAKVLLEAEVDTAPAENSTRDWVGWLGYKPKGHGNILKGKRVSLGHDRHPFQRVFQLPDVPRPMVFHQPRDDFRPHLIVGFILFVVSGKKMHE